MESQLLVQNIEQATIILTILKINNFTPNNQHIFVQIRTDDVNTDRVPYDSNPGRKTRLVDREKPHWNQAFFYNTLDLVDDNITFILKQKDGTQLGRATERNIKYWKAEYNLGKNGTIERQIQLRYNQSQLTGVLEVRVDFKQNHSVIGGICMPDLSLVPKQPYEAKYNAIDGYNPNLKTNRANCFSFYDGDMVPGFDYIDIYPPKFKHPKDLK